MGCHVIIIWLGVSKGMVPVKHLKEMVELKSFGLPCHNSMVGGKQGHGPCETLKQIMVELKAFGLPCHNNMVGGKQGHGPCETFKTNYGRVEILWAAMS